MKKKQPNILVICSDEHHPRMSGYLGHPYVKTPNLDRLAEKGTVFTHAYCNSPVCTPSRMSFITGKYVSQIGSWFIGVPLDRKEMTWPRRLDMAGIPSTMLGKMDFCGDYQDGGFTDYKILEVRGAFDPYPRRSPLPSRTIDYIRPDKRMHLINSGVREDIVTDGHDGHKLGFYDHDRIVTEWAIDYLRQKGSDESGKPWALYLGYLFPHWPFKVPKKYFDMYYPDNIKLPHDARFPINESLHPELQAFQKAQDLGDVDEETLRRTVATYYGMITCMDEMIGRVLEELKNQGMDEDTYIIYTSDHGESLGEHGVFYKQCSYDGSCGIPLIISGPDVVEGQRVEKPVSLVDMYPTIMEMANLDTEPDRQGYSWLPLARGEEQTERPDYAFAEYHGNFFRRDWYMLVKGDYKYTFYINNRPTLFNMKEDPLEMDDLAVDLSYKPILDEFEELLRSVIDPEAVSMQSKRDLGMIGPDGEDYCETLTFQELHKGYETGRFERQPEFVQVK